MWRGTGRREPGRIGAGGSREVGGRWARKGGRRKAKRDAGVMGEEWETLSFLMNFSSLFN